MLSASCWAWAASTMAGSAGGTVEPPLIGTIMLVEQRNHLTVPTSTFVGLEAGAVNTPTPQLHFVNGDGIEILVKLYDAVALWRGTEPIELTHLRLGG